MQPVMFEIIGVFSVSWYAKTVIYFLCLPEISGSGRKKIKKLFWGADKLLEIRYSCSCNKHTNRK